MESEPEIVGPWVRERVLGCGGFGIVTLWKKRDTNEQIAIKKCRAENETLSEKHKERWTQEVEMMQRIDNENIVAFRKLPLELNILYKYNPSKLAMLSMEFCTQGDLRSVLSRAENCCGLPESDVRYILNDLMNAISYLHTLKITHRDLKPENIVLQSSDRSNGIIYKLIDLGYAKELDAKSICASFVGTLQYLAPELLYSKTYSCSVDYWSMGLVAFEIICGIRPFLPNKSPAQWMYHVRKKSFDTICIYQENENDDSIIYSKEIFRESHVSSCFKRDIEKWLQLALEFQPRQRGYRNYDAENLENNKLEIFTSLQMLLNKKILTVFSVYTCEFLSYEIDDCTQISTLQGWIEIDTKIAKNKQILLSQNCDNIDTKGLAIELFDKTYARPMLYVYEKSTLLLLDIKPKFIPDLVEKMLQNATKELQYYFQKRSYAHSLYFIYTETNLYNSVLDACTLYIKYINKICDQTSHDCRKMNTSMEKLIAQKDFSREILDFDFKRYLKNYCQNADHWTISLNAIIEKIDVVHGACNQIATRHESAYRRASKLIFLANKDYSKHNTHEMNTHLEEALECYSLVQGRSKENRTKPECCKSMARILYKVLKSRDKMLRDKTFRNFLQVIIELNNEIEKIQPLLNSATEHIEKYRLGLLDDHIARQTKIWDFTIKQKQPKQKNANFVIGNPNTTNNNYTSPITLQKPLDFILGNNDQQEQQLSQNPSEIVNKNKIANSISENDSMKTSSTTTNGTNKEQTSKTTNSLESSNDVKISIQLPNFIIGQPTSEMISYNQNLRLELEEKTHQSFVQYKNILSEPLDFSFLNEE